MFFFKIRDSLIYGDEFKIHLIFKLLLSYLLQKIDEIDKLYKLNTSRVLTSGELMILAKKIKEDNHVSKDKFCIQKTNYDARRFTHFLLDVKQLGLIQIIQKSSISLIALLFKSHLQHHKYFSHKSYIFRLGYLYQQKPNISISAVFTSKKALQLVSIQGTRDSLHECRLQYINSANPRKKCFSLHRFYKREKQKQNKNNRGVTFNENLYL